jgi:hypothetical protein
MTHLYIMVSPKSVTQRMINLSSSNTKSDMLMIGDMVVLKVPTPVNDLFLDFRLYTEEEMRKLIIDNSKKKSMWSWLLGGL